MHVTELDLSPAALACLKAADIHLVDQLLEHGTGDLIQHPTFSKGLELYEIICELHRHGLTFSRHGRRAPTEREREMFRLRAVTGLTLDEIGERFDLSRGRIHQLLRMHFRLDVVPPAAKARRPPPPSLRKHTLIERRRLYLLACVAIKRHYRKPLTLEMVATALATSPRQIQRAFAQFSDSTFHDDLVARRMSAAAELLSQPTIPVRDVASQVGYRQGSHFACAFRGCFGISPTGFRTTC
jgi:AraC-like DNA-binding protein